MIQRVIIFFIVVVLGSFVAAYAWSILQGLDFWAALGNIGTILGIISFVPIAYAVYEYVQYKRREEQDRLRIHTEAGTQPAVLIVSMGGGCIRNSVEAYLKGQDGFKDFDFEHRVFVVHRDDKVIQPSDADGIMVEVEEKQDDIRSKAADKVHLFLKAPMPIAVMVGAVLANRTPTLVYHYQTNKGYENWGALQR